MATNKLKDRFDELERLARGAGLKHYPVHFFEVPVGVIYEVASYGLPTRYSHWSFGKVYDYQKTYGEMGMSKIYELILNNNPSYAFLDKSNPDTINLLVAAHCFGHSDFFANNIMFRRCGETDMVNQAKQHAEIIDNFRRDYGDDEVDDWLDVALALERHIDVFRGLYREKYEERHVEYKERKRGKWDEVAGKAKPLIQKVVKGIYIPPHPEKDILWFLSNYANLEPWQQAIFDIVRRESYYFYPQYRCVVAGSMLLSPGIGFIKIEDICPPTVGSMPAIHNLVGAQDGVLHNVSTSHVHTMPASELVRVELGMGLTIEGTPEHPIEVLLSDLTVTLKPLSALTTSDYAVVRRNTQIYGDSRNLISHLDRFQTAIADNHRHKFFSVERLRDRYNWSALAKIAGYVCSEGNFKNYTISFANKDKIVCDDYIGTFSYLFELEPSRSERKDGVVQVSSRNERLYEVLSSLGFDKLDSSESKEIPWFVLQGDLSMQASFLRAYFEGDGMNNGEKISATSKSRILIQQVQLMLLNMDIFSKIYKSVDSSYGDFYRLDIRGSDAAKFLSFVGFITDRKQNTDVSNTGRLKETEYVPFVLSKLNELRRQRKEGTYYRCFDGVLRHLRFGIPSDKGMIRSAELSRRITDELPEFCSNCCMLDSDFGRQVELLLSMKDVIFQPIVNVATINEQKLVYDVTVPQSHVFVCNAVVNHNTKIMNEGWASYWHAELMRQYSFGDDNDYGVKGLKYPLNAEEHLDFVASHEKVVQPGLKMHLKEDVPDIDPRTGRVIGSVKRWHHLIAQNPHLFHYATRINPYYVGFRMFRDIKERWDEYFKQGYMENEWGDKIPVTINGDQKIREVMEEEDDVSFFRNYLTDELSDKLHLFVYGSTKKYNDKLDIQEAINEKLKEEDLLDESSELGQIVFANKTLAVRTKDTKDIINAFAKVHNNYGVPALVIRRVDESGLLRIEHLVEDDVNCDLEYATQVLKYVHRAWGREVELVRKDPSQQKTYVLKYNGYQAELDYHKIDYPECVEKDAAPSSW